MITPSFGLTATERVLPKLALDFTTAALDSRITFTRTTGASNPATYANSNGYITSATNNEPRFDYDPITLACKGLLIEESRVNLCLYSNDFRNTADAGSSRPWTYTTVTLTTAATTSPDNTTNASKIIETATTSDHRIIQGATFTAGSTSLSFYAKAAERKRILIREGSSSGACSTFDLSTGTVISNESGGIGFIAPASNGFYRCTLTLTMTAGARNISVYLLEDTATGFANVSYTGNGTSGAYIYGAQYEAGAFATSYIPTTTTALTRNADVATMTGTNFSDWFNASEGTFYTRSTILAGATNNRIAFICDNTASNYISAGPSGGNVVAGGSVQAAMTRVISNLGFYSSVTAYKANSFANSVNGDAPITDSSGTVPTVSQMNIGSLISTGSVGSGHAIKIQYWPQRLTNAEVQAFSKG